MLYLMSSLLVETRVIDQILPHPNADRLELAHIAGWQAIVPKGEYVAGEVVIYIPPDVVIPRDLAGRIGVTNYLVERADESGDHVLVTKQIKLRGEPSYGLVVDRDVLSDMRGSNVPGLDVSSDLGLKKFVPPARPVHGSSNRIKNTKAVLEVAGFPQYVDIENWRNYKGAIQEGEEVVATEKLHGANSRVGLVDGEWMAGSRRLRRLAPASFKPKYLTHQLTLSRRVRLAWKWFTGLFSKRQAPAEDKTYWFPLTVPGVQELLLGLECDGVRSATLYGEIVGDSVQDLHYGYTDGKLGYFAFDIKADGKYLPYDAFEKLTDMFQIPRSPALYRGSIQRGRASFPV
jgi:RNA ligase (TIGR02306 family)